MRRFLEKNTPPGFGYETELTAVIAALVVSFCISLLSFCYAYTHARQALFIRRGMDLILDESRTMPDFVFLLGDKLLWLFIAATIILLAASALHYAYHFTGSKSIYLMRRLPNGLELHRRCLLFPVLSAIIFVLAAALALLICYAIYMNATPKACLTPGQWQKIWSVFL